MIIAIRILTPIHEIQYLFKINNYLLYRVINNWMLIKQSLIKSITKHNTKHCQLFYIVNILWNVRFLKQITLLYVVANLLFPNNHVVKSMKQIFEIAFSQIIIEFFQLYAASNQITICMRDFLTFRDQYKTFFSHKNFVWTHVNNSIIFWNIINFYCSAFDQLINRLM